MTNYKLVENLAPGLVVLRSDRYGNQVWCETSATLRTPKDCEHCEAPLKGKIAFRPISNLSNRMHRLCPACMNILRNGP